MSLLERREVAAHHDPGCATGVAELRAAGRLISTNRKLPCESVPVAPMSGERLDRERAHLGVACALGVDVRLVGEATTAAASVSVLTL